MATVENPKLYRDIGKELSRGLIIEAEFFDKKFGISSSLGISNIIALIYPKSKDPRVEYVHMLFAGRMLGYDIAAANAIANSAAVHRSISYVLENELEVRRNAVLYLEKEREDFAKNRKLDFDYTHWLNLAISDLVAQAMNSTEKEEIGIPAYVSRFLDRLFGRKSIAPESNFGVNFRPTAEQMKAWGEKWKKN